MANEDYPVRATGMVARLLATLAGTLLIAMAAPAGAASGFVILHKFQGKSDGEIPEAGLTLDTVLDNGIMYGTTFGELNGDEPSKHCSKGCGSQFDLFGKGLTTNYFFQAGTDGAFPTGEVFVQNGVIYGTTELGGYTSCGGLGCGTAFMIGTGGETAVLRFCTSQEFPACKNGALPHGGLMLGADGNLYGTTSLGGIGTGYACDSNFGGCGTVYGLTPDLATETVLYSFCQLASCQDGAIPYGKLLQDASGDFFGTTQFGGSHGLGVIFELTPGANGYTETVLYNFCSLANCADGAIPEAGLIADANGNLYGTASAGGGGTCAGSYPGCGTVFEYVLATGTLNTLHSFVGVSDGALPQAPLTMDASGNLYGTTNKGGDGAYCKPAYIGCGMVFELAPDGTETFLHIFGQLPAPRPDGGQPEGALLLDQGYLYGATRVYGNAKCQCGTLFKVLVPGTAPATVAHARRPRFGAVRRN